MSDLLDMAAEVRRALQLSETAREELAHAGVLLQEAISALQAVLIGSTQSDARHSMTTLADLPCQLDIFNATLHQVEQLMLVYLTHLGVGHCIPTDHRPADNPPTTPFPAIIGSWHGKTAADHARNEGTNIGRAPQRQKKSPVREVGTVEELEELFEALSKGARTENIAGYPGQFCTLPDGTTIGYRGKARTSAHPTIDIRTPDRIRLKIHVNGQGWDIHDR